MALSVPLLQATVAWQKARAQKAKRNAYDKTVIQQPDFENMENAAATVAPKFNLGGGGRGHHPFQETVKEDTPSTLATPTQPSTVVEMPPSHNTIADGNLTSHLVGLNRHVSY